MAANSGPEIVDVPLEGVDKNVPDLSTFTIDKIRTQLLIPNKQAIYVLCRMLQDAQEQLRGIYEATRSHDEAVALGIPFGDTFKEVLTMRKNFDELIENTQGK